MAEPTRHPFPFATALRESLREGYGLAELKRDAIAGTTVGIIALPLSMALAIASGVTPQAGLATAIVAGVVISLAGGSRVQVSGPSASVVILLPIVERHGVEGLVVATLMAGLLLLLLGLARLGRAVTFIPFPVVTGFSAGIGLVIGVLQCKDLLGLEPAGNPVSVPAKAIALAEALPGARWGDAAVGLLTLAVLLGWPRLSRRIPSALVAVSVAAIAAAAASRFVPGFEAATIASRFGTAEHPHGIPLGFPEFRLPWIVHDETGASRIADPALLRELLPSALALAMLGAIESLLSTVVADAMGSTRSDPDAELVGQGLGNLAIPFFGGIAATGAMARTTANVRAGARSPFASVVHGLVILLALVAFAPLLGKLPMAAMAALLLVVAWNMSRPAHVLRTIRSSPRQDSAILLTCLAVTVAFDMVVGVLVGVALASVLLIRRVADLSSTSLVEPAPSSPAEALPPGVVVYQIAGPLFFGAAQRAMFELERIPATRGQARTVVLDLTSVPAIDATGLFNLESAVKTLAERRVRCLIAGATPPVAAALDRALPHWSFTAPERIANRAEAIARARALAEST